MANPFNIKNSANNEVRTANFDWSHANNLSFDIGTIVPTLVKQVPAKSSLKITPVAGLQFMPMVFPNQTRMYCRQSFFKVPIRTLWKDWMDYVGNFREGLVEPYHDFNGQIPETCSLYDYLGLPTTYAGSWGSSRTYSVNSFTDIVTFNLSRLQYNTPGQGSQWLSDFWSDQVTSIEEGKTLMSDLLVSSIPIGNNNSIKSDQSVPDTKLYIRQLIGVKLDLSDYVKSSTSSDNYVEFKADASSLPSGTNLYLAGFIYNKSGEIIDMLKVEIYHQSSGASQLKANISLNELTDTPDYIYLLYSPANDDLTNSANSTQLQLLKNPFGFSVSYVIGSTSSVGQVRELFAEVNPYYDSTSANADKQLKISAYPARAYEAVYNAFFRDNRNRPYYIDGQVEYNRWIPSLEGGADTYKYTLHQCNWERDMFTTAVQSPQQGIAPLVGITTYDDVQTNDEGVVTTTKRVALTDEDGRSFGIEFDSNDDGLLDVRYTQLSDSTKVSKPRALIELAQSGISIADIRNVNAYQKFLELNMRQGYSYRDIIQGRFNVKVRYDALQIPEYLGGFSELVDMNAVTQTVQRADTGEYADQLGAMAGSAGVRKRGHSISVFCDEESIIIGVIYVSPVPIYSQILPKHFLYRNLLDHFQPEFANIGFQPITYRELCPIQAYNEKPESLYDTFGYQRPWYEYVQALDVAHGLFRTSLHNFIMNRTFDVKPELSDSFLLVDKNQVNDVFSVTAPTNKIFGQIYFEITAKLPIPRVAAPRLG